MARFRVRHQDTPFNFTKAGTLVVEAATRAEAFVTAVDYLARAGLTPSYSVAGLKVTVNAAGAAGLAFTEEECAAILASGLPASMTGSTRIRELAAFDVRVGGHVVEEG